MNSLGYLLYLLAVLLPGLGVGELLGIWRKGRTLTEAAGYLIGIGLLVDTLVLFVGSSGIQIGDIPLLGVTINKFYVLIGVGTLCYLSSAVMRKSLTSLPRPTRSDGVVALMMALQALMAYLLFQKYPIFPEYNSIDFRVHVNIVNSLLSSGSSIPGGILYYGVHYQLALGVLLTGGVTLMVVQRVAAILAVLGTPVVFLAGSRILGDRKAGFVSALIYSLTATIWFGSLFDTGLYPNFFGILASLFVLALAADLVRDGYSVGGVIALIGAVGMFYLSHYSDISIIPAVLLVPVTLLLTKKFRRVSAIPTLLIVVPAGLAAVVLPGLVTLLLGFQANAGGNVLGGTVLSGLLSPVPIIANMATVTYDDVGFLVLVILAIPYAWRTLKERDALRLIPVVWFLSVVFAAPHNEGSWRLSYIGLVPLTLMATGGIVNLLPAPSRKQKQGTLRGSRGAVIAVMIILLVTGSWGTTIVSDGLTNTQLSAWAQQNVYDALVWFGNNTKGAGLLSVSDYRFLYAPQIIGRDAAYQFFSTPSQAIPFVRSHGFSYIAVTLVVTASLPPVPGLFPWNNFPASSTGNLTLVYSNDDVRLYKLP